MLGIPESICNIQQMISSRRLGWVPPYCSNQKIKIELRNYFIICKIFWRWSPQNDWKRLKRIWNDQPLHIMYWEITSVNIIEQDKWQWPEISVLPSIRWKAVTILYAHRLWVQDFTDPRRSQTDNNYCSQFSKLWAQMFKLTQTVCFAIVSSLFYLPLDFMLCLLQWYSF